MSTDESGESGRGNKQEESTKQKQKKLPEAPQGEKYRSENMTCSHNK
jgi:hypothetical protein